MKDGNMPQVEQYIENQRANIQSLSVYWESHVLATVKKYGTISAFKRLFLVYENI